MQVTHVLIPWPAGPWLFVVHLDHQELNTSQGYMVMDIQLQINKT